jgi:hypothetical protein
MTYSLILLVCIAGQPVECATKSQLVTGLSQDRGTAIVQVLTAIDQWVDEHPAEDLRAWQILPLADT